MRMYVFFKSLKKVGRKSVQSFCQPLLSRLEKRSGTVRLSEMDEVDDLFSSTVFCPNQIRVLEVPNLLFFAGGFKRLTSGIFRWC